MAALATPAGVQSTPAQGVVAKPDATLPHLSASEPIPVKPVAGTPHS
jgi:hypothetical protein